MIKMSLLPSALEDLSKHVQEKLNSMLMKYVQVHGSCWLVVACVRAGI
jgi:hypothetical protein